eukprot:COSAG02_NODE_133_length_34692_cov_83.845229_7_plen_258_part_00
MRWDSRYVATQSLRTSTACRLTMSRSLAAMLTAADEISARWNTRLFQWNTCANPSVPDQICTQRPESHNAHTFSVICDGRKILERWNTHIRQSSSGPAGPSSAPRCHRGRVASVSAAALSLHLFKNVVVSVPAFQSGGDLGGSGWKPAQTNFQAISVFASWNTRRHSECSSLFQRSSRGSGRAVSEGGGHWARRPVGSNRTGAGSRSAPPPSAGAAAPVARRRRLAQPGVPVCRSVPGCSSVPGLGSEGRRPLWTRQ